MTRSLFILMLVGFMVTVGLYYDRQATQQLEQERDLLGGTALIENQATLSSGVDLAALDRETRPQDDFYQFANGGWLDATEIPEIYSGYTVYHQVFEEAELALRQIVEEAAGNPGEPGSESQQVGDIYNSWLDEEAINLAGIEPILAELNLVDSIEDTASLVKVMAKRAVAAAG